MQREKLILVFGGLLLFILGFDALMGVHYITHLSGPALIAIMSIVAGTFLAIVAAWFSIKKDSSLLLRVAAFGSKIALICVGGLCSASIITLYFHERAEGQKTQEATVTKAAENQAELAKLEARRKEKKDIQDARERQIAEINAAAVNMRRSGVGPQAVKAFVENGMAGLPIVPAEVEATPNLVAAAEATNKAKMVAESKTGFKAWLLEFSDNGVYYVPTVTNLGVFILLSGVLLFGGIASTTKKEAKEKDEFPQELEVKNEVGK